MFIINIFEFAGMCLNWVWVNVIVNLTKLFLKHWWLLPALIVIGFIALIIFILI